MATSGAQVLTGTATNDNLVGGSGNDTINGGAGSDTINAGSGNDTLIYDVATGTAVTKDLYTGGSGIDTLVLRFTLQQWLSASNQTQVANYLAHLAAVTNTTTGQVSNSTSSDFVFTFGSATLTIQMTETLRVFVDGVELNPADAMVTANNDTATTGEEGPATSVYVLANDIVPDLVKSIAVATPPAHGTATLVKPDANVPSTWYFSYAPNSSYYQYLSSGQTATDTFTYTVTDADGDTSTATVTMTITGANDAVSITSSTQAGAVVEDTTGSASGTITFDDIDLADGHTATVSSSNSTTLGTFSLAAVNEAAGASSGSVGWNYALNHGAAQYLASGESVTEVFKVTVDDGHGSTTFQNVSITISGTNDTVAITSYDYEGLVVEDGVPASVNGSIAFSDADLTDTHTASFSTSSPTNLGTFELGTVTEGSTTAEGSLGWTYTLNHAAAQYLAAGETVTEVFLVTLDDDNGSTITEEVEITITGTNDDVVLTSGVQQAEVTEDEAPGSATGTIEFDDADLTDEHAVSFTSANATTLGLFELGTVSEAAGTVGGSVGWTYTLDNAAAQYLGAGESVDEVFTVELDDGNGSTTTQEVTITISGTNDDVIVTSGVQEAEVTEDEAPGSATGTIEFDDADLTDEHAVSFTSANATNLGLFELGTVSEAPGTVGGSVGWTYTLDNAAAQYLGAGESVDEVFTVELDDGNGSTTTQEVTFTISGTNDDVIVTSGVQAAEVTEDEAPASATGTIEFDDADLTDEHAVSFTSANATTLGLFELGTVSEAAGTVGGSVGWTYTLDNAAAQYLGAGESVDEVFTVELDDGNGSTTTQEVTITIAGTNDDVIVTSGVQEAEVTEDEAPGSATGTIEFDDADLTDEHAVSFTSANATTLGLFELGTVSEAAGTVGGSVGWTYTLDNAAAQYLGAGESVDEVFTVELDDGNGSTTTQEVTITISGTNDDVIVTSGVQEAEVTEDEAPGSATGTIEFDDADLTDEHAVSFTSANATTLGLFELGTVSEAAGTVGGSVGWTYTLDNAAAQYLGAGESVDEVFTVELDDGNGSTTTQEVTITISGTNDDVIVTSGVQEAEVTEDEAPGSATGTIEFDDADLTDEHAVSFTSANATTLGLFELGTVSEAAGTVGGSVGWTYTLDNAAAQYLGAGESVDEVFTVELDDGNGSTTTQEVTITISGTNDDVIVTSGVQEAEVTEDEAPGSATGTIEFDDADLTDEHAVSFTSANATNLGLFELGTVSEAPGTVGGSVGWTYTLDNAAAQYLGAGESVDEVFTVELDDGNGSTTTQEVTFTISGTNDDVIVTSGVQAAEVTEDEAPASATGTIEFDDADLTDEHAVSFTSANATTLGLFELGTVSEAAGTVGGSVGWTYTLDNAAAQYLGAGESVDEVFTVELDDGNGSTTTQEVTITIAGTNDDVIVTSGVQEAEVTEDEAPGSATGTIEFDDADLTDEHAVSFTSANATTLGLFELGTVSEAAGTVGGSVGWTYTLDNAAAQYLGAGESVDEVFTVELDDGNGSTTTQEVTITISGTNDDVIVTSGVQEAEVTEDEAPGSATGTIEFDDADLTDEHAVSFTSANATTLGLFELGTVSEAAGTVGGSVGWTYTLDNAAAQYLGAGESVDEVFTVELDDGNGSTTTHEVTITISGTNDEVIVTSGVQAAEVTEDEAPGSATGTIEFDDADLTDEHAVSFTSANATTLGLFELGTVSEAAGTVGGSVGWTYTLDNAAAQYLGAGESVDEVFTVELDDGNGSTTTQEVTITISGTNDDVIVTSGVQEAEVTEDEAPGSATGTIEFDDADLTDEHAVSFTSANATTLGLFELGTVSEAPGTVGGSVGWTYTLDNAAAQYLGAGESVDEVFTVELDDGNGSTTTQEVTITISGTNDDVIVTSGVQEAEVTEDEAPGSATGTIEFDDADLTDEHAVSFTSANATTLGLFELGTVSEAAGTVGGSVGWTYTLDNAAAQYLSAGESVTETFTVELDDGNGSTTTQDVTITIAGANDGPTITSDIQTGAVAEDGTASASGAVTFDDVDLTDTHTARISAAPAGTTYGTFSLDPVSEALDAANGSVGWQYNVSNTAVQFLALNQTITEVYTVEVKDNSGAITTQNVTITITGANDGPTITSSTQAGAVVEDGLASASGSVTFEDVDLTDTHTARISAAPSGTTYGDFSLDPVSEALDAATGSVGWHYNINNTTAQALAKNQVITEVYTIEVKDDKNAIITQNVTITITGANDIVTITAANSTGTVTEDSPATATGTISFNDVDLADGHTTSITPSASNTTALGDFTLAAVNEAAGAASGSVAWTYTLNSTLAQYLAAGQSVTETYAVGISDGQGSTVSQNVTVTIAGTNDVVTITSSTQAGAVTEDGATQTATGTVTFNDVDLTDTHTTSVTSSNATTLGVFALAAVSESATTAPGSVGWTYTLTNTAAQYLASGQQVVETFTVNVNDGHGSTVSQVVTITINGANDAVTITSGPQTGSVTEDGTLSATGTVAFTDPDLSNGHTASVAASPSNTTSLGALILGSVSEAANAETGSVGWTYNLNNAAAQYLAAGQVVTETYVVTVIDGFGSTTTQNVVVTITGSADGATDIKLNINASIINAQLPNSSPFGQFVAGPSGSYEYSMAVTERDLTGATLSSNSNDLIVSASGALSNNGMEDNRVYEMAVKAKIGTAEYIETFSVITGSGDADTIKGVYSNALYSSENYLNGDDLIFSQNNADVIWAGGGDDSIFGQNQVDEIHGGDGNDTMSGGSQNDFFVFDTALNAATNLDTILDFTSGDKIRLSSGIFTQVALPPGGLGTLNSTMFWTSSSGLTKDANDYIQYDATTKILYYDADGSGAGVAIAFAQLVGSGTISGSSDFIVVAPPVP